MCCETYCAKVHCVCQSCQPWASKTQFLRPHCIKSSRSDNCGYMINEIVTEKLFTRPCNLVSQLVQEALFIKLGGIGHLHDDVILLVRPESFSFLLSYFNFVIPVRFR